jgi:pectin methylesterase-like acyl-CoA thioesterase
LCSYTTTTSVINSLSGPVHNLNSGLNYCSIQVAVNAATNGDVITIDPGTYNEQVVVSKELTIKSATPTQALIDFTGTVSGKPTLFDVTANNVTI